MDKVNILRQQTMLGDVLRQTEKFYTNTVLAWLA